MISNTKIDEAKEYAALKHQGQKRKGGDDYINHPIRVAEKVSTITDNQDLIIAAYLHDTLEDTDATLDEINSLFGDDVGKIVLELTNDEEMKNKLGKEDYLSQKLLNMSDNALMVKLCDRYDNICDLRNSNNLKFSEKYINETIGILTNLINNGKFTSENIILVRDIILELATYIIDDSDKMEELLNLMSKLSNKNKDVKVLEKKLKVC